MISMYNEFYLVLSEEKSGLVSYSQEWFTKNIKIWLISKMKPVGIYDYSKFLSLIMKEMIPKMQATIMKINTNFDPDLIVFITSIMCFFIDIKWNISAKAIKT